ncbi:sensor domain-containing diguanylate cyclase [Vibrio sp. TH_r3]|uniref:sensor domain-containing diguanylate cyclase n=1 Tax=Vibrio sp. TH_r3 TaxID=3082084 RepID=UPI002954796E|nr:sensor domain-containing diguanylate cyclase [Vibrio sp. TH_r3]MDV7103625.1 sensor domain-containing diguanylate cyclase [Vibrio sp. TH_r3]
MTHTRLTWLLVSLILCGFIITSFVSYQVAHETLEEQIKQDSLPLTSDNIYSEIQQDLIRPIFISSLMAQDTFVRDWTLSGEVTTDKIVQYLNEIKQQYGTVTSFFVSDKTRNYYHYSGILKQVSQDDPDDAWYFRVKSQDPGIEYEVNIDQDTANRNDIVVFVNYRVYDFQRRFMGVIGVGLSSNAVAGIIEKYKKRYNREIYFINELGEVTLHGSQPFSFNTIQEKEGLRSLATQILTTPSMSGSYSAEGDEFYISSRWVEEFQWYIMVQQKDTFDKRSFITTLLKDFSLSIAVAFLVLLVIHYSVKGYQTRLVKMAHTDKLTGISNRQAFDDIVVKESKLSNQSGKPLSIALLDIDHFKSVNDSYGHQIGDHVLQRVAHACQSQLEGLGHICRWGGEEFIILLPDCNVEQAITSLEKLRLTIENQSVKPKVTVSIGVVERLGNENIDSLVHRADIAMYQAKKNGRNQIFSDNG